MRSDFSENAREARAHALYVLCDVRRDIAVANARKRPPKAKAAVALAAAAAAAVASSDRL